jgi:hypothetical protein
MFLPYFILFVCLQLVCCAIKCDKETNECDAQERRYLIYGVNFGEGFNLRRDVYLRIANVVRQLREQGNKLNQFE